METKIPTILKSAVYCVRFLFWALLIVVILTQVITNTNLPRKRVALIRSIQEERKSMVITLIHREEQASLFGMPVSRYIDIDDDESILRAIHLTPADAPIDLILHTPGGLVLAASQIAHALENHKGKVTVFVPHYAMSGGTLLALAADAIVMDPNAILGPVDPQLGDMPAASILRAVELKTPKGVEDNTLILADIASKAINQMGALVTELLSKHMPAKNAEELAGLLSTGQFTHDFPITAERAKALGLPISTDMPQSIYKLMALYPQSGVGRPSVSYVPIR